MDQSLADNALKDSVDKVIGKIQPTDLNIQCMPSSGHIMPLSMASGKKLPSPMNVADVSVLQNTATMNPTNTTNGGAKIAKKKNTQRR